MSGTDLGNFGERTILGVHLKTARLRSAHCAAKYCIDNAAVTCNYDSLAKVLINDGIDRRVHTLMKLSDGFAAREKLGVRVATPVGRTMPTNKLHVREPVTFWAWVVLPESWINID
jgi:hypothetical protein